MDKQHKSAKLLAARPQRNDMILEPPLKALGLIRVSTVAQAGEDRAGVPAQRAACLRVAATNNLLLDWTEEIIGVSGADVQSSPGFQRLKTLIQSGECKAIVLKEVSRLMRPQDMGDYAVLQILKQHKVKVYTPTGVIDFATDIGQLVGMMQFALAGYELSQLRARMLDARDEMRFQQKRHASGPQNLPFAVSYDYKTFVWSYVEPDIGRVKQVFSLFLSGVTTYRRLALKTGLRYANVRNILRNRIYTGVRAYETMLDPADKRVHPDSGKKVKPRLISRPDPHYVRVIEHGAITDEQFNRVQHMLGVKTKRHWRERSGQDDPFLYRGLLICADCKEPMTTIRHRGKSNVHDYYLCSGVKGNWKVDPTTYEWHWQRRNKCHAHRCQRERLERMLDEFITATFTEAASLRAVIAEYKRSLSDTGGKERRAAMGRLERDLALCDQRRKRLKEAWLDVDTRVVKTRGEFLARQNELDEQEKAARFELSRIRPNAPNVTAADLALLAVPFMRWPKLSRDDRRALLMTRVPGFEIRSFAPQDAPRTIEYSIKGFFLQVDTPPSTQPQPHARKENGRATDNRVEDGMVLKEMPLRWRNAKYHPSKALYIAV